MRVFELARELGVTSKELLDRCEAAGLADKKSLSSLADEEVEQIKGLFKAPSKAKPARQKAAKPSKAAAPKKPVAPEKPSKVAAPKKEQAAPKPKAPQPAAPAEAAPEAPKPAAEVLEKKPEKVEKKPERAAAPPAEKKPEEVAKKPERAAAPEVPPTPPPPPAPVELRTVEIDEAITVGGLAEKLGVKPNVLIIKLMELGVLATINQALKAEDAQMVGLSFGAEVVFKSDEQVALEEILGEVDKPEDLTPRPPVVTVMGHVDHGKTTLLDAIRNSDVASSEHGRITQHIGAYEVRLGERAITFLDTPGHELFTAMRARGAKVTDIVILVVAADDGVMPQTVEAIDHSRDAEVPIIVAVNKCDLPGANPDRVLNQLIEHNLIAERFGGDTVVVNVSALRRQGVDDLLEMILLQADILELKANPKRRAVGTVVEARMDRGKGPVGTVLVQNGTLHVGDAFVCGVTAGKVRSLMNDRGQSVPKASLSEPVEVSGFSEVPQAGDLFHAVESERRARVIVNARKDRARAQEQGARVTVTLQDLHTLVERGEAKDLHLIVKGDVQGTVEAVADAAMGLATDEIGIKVVHSGVGPVNESDVVLAEASGAIIVGMHVSADVNALALSKQNGVEIRTYRIIYDCIDEIRKAMEGLLEPERVEVSVGKAVVRKAFKISRLGFIAGCMVTEGKIARSLRVRVFRGGQMLAEGLGLASLKRYKDDVREVASGAECGIRLDGFNDIQEGDVIEAYTVEVRERTL